MIIGAGKATRLLPRLRRARTEASITLSKMVIELGNPLHGAVFVKGCQIAIDILAEHVIRSRKPQLGRITTADPDFLLLPEPAFQVHPHYARYIDRSNRASK